ELLVAAAQPLHRAWPVVLDQDVGFRGETVDQRLSVLRLQVDHEAALVAVQVAEEADGEAGQAARGVALGRRLDLDHVGAEVSEHRARGRPTHGMAELQHAQTAKRRIALVGTTHGSPNAPYSGGGPAALTRESAAGPAHEKGALGEPWV